MEDAAVLARCIDAAESLTEAFRLYEDHRKPRVSRVQAISSANTWMSTATGNDPDWLYGYDAWTAPLEMPAPSGA
jgi:salicylate hydroxylase/6-hydroxynicotinate 3-monooxygenase